MLERAAGAQIATLVPIHSLLLDAQAQSRQKSLCYAVVVEVLRACVEQSHWQIVELASFSLYGRLWLRVPLRASHVEATT